MVRSLYKKRLQRPFRAAIYGGFVAMTWLMKVIGPGVSSMLARAVGYLAGMILPHERRLAAEHLALALPERDAAARAAIRRDMFVHFGQSGAELLHIEHTLKNTTVSGVDAVAQAARKGGAIVISGHIGNWEVLGAAVARTGIPLTVIARRIYDPRMDRWMRAWRGQFGIETVVRDAPDAARCMLRALRNGRVLVMLIDQDTDVPSVWVPFFGQTAKTPSGPARLAMRGIPVFKAWIHRNADDSHEGYMQPLEKLPDDLESMTAVFNQHLEDIIREQPAQWVWLHRRWKTPKPTAS